MPRLARLLLAPSVLDWIVAGYAAGFALALALAAPSPARDRELAYVVAVGAVFAGAVLLFRGRLDPRARGLDAPRSWVVAYRLVPVAGIMAIFFNLRAILPLAAPGSVDEALYRIDLALLGVEPALAIDQWLPGPALSWFAFFYAGYFLLVATFVFGSILTGRDDRRVSLILTALGLVVAAGQLTYVLVPGVGPWAHLEGRFAAPLDGGVFHDLIVRLAAAVGPQKDVFPSLHTAVPATLALVMWREDRRLAPLLTFYAVNIAAATIVLRWHWTIDVVAGLAYAAVAAWAAPRLLAGYQRLRERHGAHAGVIW